MATKNHNQASDDAPEQPLPAWLYDDPEEMTPPELRAIYGKLADVEVTKVCEAARKSLRDGYIAALRTVREALAPSGLFKEWCEAAGLNYNTAKSALFRADAAQQAKQPSVGASATPSAASGGGPRASSGKHTTHTLSVKFASDEELGEAKQLLRDYERRVFGYSADAYGNVLLDALRKAEAHADGAAPVEPADTPEDVRRRLQAAVEAEPEVVEAEYEAIATEQYDADTHANGAEAATQGVAVPDSESCLEELRAAMADERAAALAADSTEPPPAGEPAVSEEGPNA